MLTLVESIKKNVNLKPKTVYVDNFIFRTHYRLTFWILLVCNILVCSRQYIGEHIKCLTPKYLEHVIDTFCFFTGTYTVVKHSNKTIYNSKEIAHPGVGPSTEDDEIIRHAYYQWVPFVLFLQALCFYIPHLLWKAKEGGRMKNIIEGFTLFDQLDHEKKDGSLKRMQLAFRERVEVNRGWTQFLIFCEFLNLVNLILQVYFTDLFLAGQFLPLGGQVYEQFNADTFSPLDVVFPKVTKCTFHKYGPSGGLQVHDVMCVMALNIINEKIFIGLWYWYLIVGILSIVGLLWRVLSFILRSSTQFNLFTFAMATTTLFDKQRELIIVMKKMTFSDWMFLRYLAMNMNGRMFKELLARMALEAGDTPRTSFEESYKKEEQPLVDWSTGPDKSRTDLMVMDT